MIERIRNKKAYLPVAIDGAKNDAVHRGGRDNSTNWLAGRLATFGLSEGEILHEVSGVAGGLPQKDVLRAVRSGIKHGRRNMRELDSPGPEESPTIDFGMIARDAASSLTSESKAELGKQLGLPAECADGVTLTGYDGNHFTFPEFNSKGRIVGITRRHADGVKLADKGGKRGIFCGQDWKQRAIEKGFLLMPEGPSDTAMLAGGGLPVLGRFSNTGGIGIIAEMVADVPSGVSLIVLGENDKHENGEHPGAKAKEQAEKLKLACPNHKVCYAFPPAGHKDCRAYAIHKDFAGIPLGELARGLSAKLRADAVEVPGSDITVNTDSVVPNIEAAERYVVGAPWRCDSSEDRAERIRESEHITAAEFSSSTLAALHTAMKECVFAGEPVEPATVLSKLRKVDDNKNWHEVIAECRDADASDSEVRRFAGEIQQDARRRQAIESAKQFCSEVAKAPGESPELMYHHAADMQSLCDGAGSTMFPSAVRLEDVPDDEEQGEAVIQDILYKGAVTTVSASYKTGKTTWLAGAFRAIEHRIHYCGKAVARNRVLVLTEETPRLWKRRMQEFGFTSDCVGFINSCDFKSQPTSESWPLLLNHLMREARRIDASVIVIDVLQRFWGVRDENDAVCVQAAFNHFDMLRKGGFATLVVCHTSKHDGGKGRAFRGSAAIGGGADILVEMRRRDPNDITDTKRDIVIMGREGESQEFSIDYDPQRREYSVVNSAPTLEEAAHEPGNKIIASLLRSGLAEGRDAKAILGAWQSGNETGGIAKTAPALRTLRDALNNGAACTPALWVRSGKGKAGSPWLYFLSK